jgi:DNA adenine methylase
VAVSPVVKWAGGKRQLLPQLTKLLPQKFNVYYEPFVGGAALLTYLYNKNLITKAIVSDTNEDLINLYETIKEDPVLLAYELGKLDLTNSSDIYYSARDEFNRSPSFTPRKAALFIYLNRFGFNGIWRINFNGNYNVPFGRHINPHIPIEKISEFSKMLKRVTLLNKSFEYATVNAKKGDFVYFDPPYQPISKTSHFTNYTSQGFTIKHQMKLAENFKALDMKGVSIMLSNSAVAEIKELYKGFYIKNVPANRSINSDASKRTGFEEVIITNYKSSQSELATQDA